MTNSQMGDIVTVIHTKKKKNILTHITHCDRYDTNGAGSGHAISFTNK